MRIYETKHESNGQWYREQNIRRPKCWMKRINSIQPQLQYPIYGFIQNVKMAVDIFGAVGRWTNVIRMWQQRPIQCGFRMDRCWSAAPRNQTVQFSQNVYGELGALGHDPFAMLWRSNFRSKSLGTLLFSKWK